MHICIYIYIYIYVYIICKHNIYIYIYIHQNTSCCVIHWMFLFFLQLDSCTNIYRQRCAPRSEHTLGTLGYTHRHCPQNMQNTPTCSGLALIFLMGAALTIIWILLGSALGIPVGSRVTLPLRNYRCGIHVGIHLTLPMHRKCSH